MRTDHVPDPPGSPSSGPHPPATAGNPGDDQALAALQRLYAILNDLRARSGGMSYLRDGLPPALGQRLGIYVFFEAGEERTGSGQGPRVVRVGTHGLTAGSKSTLRSRLANHRGSGSGGNQRTSIFRRHVGAALMASGRVPAVPGWLQGSSAPAAQREAERAVEALVSTHIGAMPFLWLPVEDEAGPNSDRGLLERNAIALPSYDVVEAADGGKETTCYHSPIEMAPDPLFKRDSIEQVRFDVS